MKSMLLAIVVTASIASAAFAGQCQDDIEKIDQALATKELALDERAATWRAMPPRCLNGGARPEAPIW